LVQLAAKQGNEWTGASDPAGGGVAFPC
jgi:hypothetical protein